MKKPRYRIWFREDEDGTYIVLWDMAKWNTIAQEPIIIEQTCNVKQKPK